MLLIYILYLADGDAQLSASATLPAEEPVTADRLGGHSVQIPMRTFARALIFGSVVEETWSSLHSRGDK